MLTKHLINAFTNGSLKDIKEAYEKGENIFKAYYMDCAIYKNNIEIVNYLIEKGYKEHEKDFNNLLYACTVKKTEIFKILMNDKVDLKHVIDDLIKSDSYNSLLYLLAFDVKICLLKHALMLACDLNRLEMVKILVERGAEIDNNKFIYDLYMKGNIEVIKLLKEYKFNIYTSYIKELEFYNRKDIRTLLTIKEILIR